MKCRLAARIAGSALLVAGTLSAAAVPASSAQTPSPQATHMFAPSPQATHMLQAMQRDLGLTADQALQRLEQQATASHLEQTLRQALGGNFGGAYFDAGQGKLTVGVTNPDALDQVRSAGANAHLVRFSADQLRAANDGLDAHKAQVPKSVTGWYTQPRTNSVTVTTARGTAKQAAAFVRSTGVDPAAVHVVKSAESPRTYEDVVGGQQYVINGSVLCSVGFSVDGGFVSAGHCGQPGDTTSGPTGTFEGSEFPGSDYSHVSVSDATPQPVVNGPDGPVTVAGSEEAAVGSEVCRTGATSGWHCGTLDATDQTVSYPEGTVSGLVRTSACAEPGDSGGPFLAGDQAQGMTSGGSGDCTSGGTTYYQPVNEVLDAYGLTLLTG